MDLSLRQRIAQCLLETSNHEVARAFFNEPVSAEDYPDYPRIVPHPMDLSLVRKKLAAGRYGGAREVRADVQRIWSNCRDFNGDGSAIMGDCRRLETFFLRSWNRRVGSDADAAGAGSGLAGALARAGAASAGTGVPAGPAGGGGGGASSKAVSRTAAPGSPSPPRAIVRSGAGVSHLHVVPGSLGAGGRGPGRSPPRGPAQAGAVHHAGMPGSAVVHGRAGRRVHGPGSAGGGGGARGPGLAGGGGSAHGPGSSAGGGGGAHGPGASAGGGGGQGASSSSSSSLRAGHPLQRCLNVLSALLTSPAADAGLLPGAVAQLRAARDRLAPGRDEGWGTVAYKSTFHVLDDANSALAIAQGSTEARRALAAEARRLWKEAGLPGAVRDVDGFEGVQVLPGGHASDAATGAEWDRWGAPAAGGTRPPGDPRHAAPGGGGATGAWATAAAPTLGGFPHLATAPYGAPHHGPPSPLVGLAANAAPPGQRGGAGDGPPHHAAAPSRSRRASPSPSALTDDGTSSGGGDGDGTDAPGTRPGSPGSGPRPSNAGSVGRAPRRSSTRCTVCVRQKRGSCGSWAAHKNCMFRKATVAAGLPLPPPFGDAAKGGSRAGTPSGSVGGDGPTRSHPGSGDFSVSRSLHGSGEFGSAQFGAGGGRSGDAGPGGGGGPAGDGGGAVHGPADAGRGHPLYGLSAVAPGPIPHQLPGDGGPGYARGQLTGGPADARPGLPLLSGQPLAGPSAAAATVSVAEVLRGRAASHSQASLSASWGHVTGVHGAVVGAGTSVSGGRDAGPPGDATVAPGGRPDSPSASAAAAGGWGDGRRARGAPGSPGELSGMILSREHSVAGAGGGEHTPRSPDAAAWSGGGGAWAGGKAASRKRSRAGADPEAAREREILAALAAAQRRRVHAQEAADQAAQAAAQLTEAQAVLERAVALDRIAAAARSRTVVERPWPPGSREVPAAEALEARRASLAAARLARPDLLDRAAFWFAQRPPSLASAPWVFR